jgi:hypothetical protein
MADKLTSSTPGPGHNGVERASFLGYVDQYSDADAAVAEAVSDRKDLRKTIKAAGINLAAFDRHRKDAEKSGAKRIEEDAEYRRYMLWRGMPVGTQPDMFAEGRSNGHAPESHIDQDEPSEHQKKRVEDAGFVAGKGGMKRDQNPWNPGSALYVLFDENWMKGQEAIADSMAPSDAAPKRKGRPPGSKNAAKTSPPPAGNGASSAPLE